MIGIPELVAGGFKLIDDLFTSDEEKEKLDIAKQQIINSLQMAQIETNRQESSHRTIFVAGWRPFIGWVCGIGLCYDFLIRTLVNGILSISHIFCICIFYRILYHRFDCGSIQIKYT